MQLGVGKMGNGQNKIRRVLWVTAGAAFLFSAFMLWNRRTEMQASAAVTEDMVQIATKPKQQPSAPGDKDEPKPASDDPEDDGVLQKIAPIEVDFEALRQENPDIIAWIYCPDTPINYPVVQAEDNSYYLRRLVDGTWNSSGTLFLDYRNADDFSDVNSVIYGHNMQNDSMFGTLLRYTEQEYYEQHPVICLLTPEKDYQVELFAGFTTPSDSAIYDLSAINEKTADEVLCLIETSTFTAEMNVKSEDRILTLSTCSYEYSNARYVVMGVLKQLTKA